jgi:hypothetical protein
MVRIQHTGRVCSVSCYRQKSGGEIKAKLMIMPNANAETQEMRMGEKQ